MTAVRLLPATLAATAATARVGSAPQADLRCGNHPPTEEQIAFAAQFAALDELTETRKDTTNEAIKINVYVHVVAVNQTHDGGYLYCEYLNIKRLWKG